MKTLWWLTNCQWPIPNCNHNYMMVNIDKSPGSVNVVTLAGGKTHGSYRQTLLLPLEKMSSYCVLCCVLGCQNRKNKKLKFYRIPATASQSNCRQVWLNAIRRKDWTKSITKNSECTHILFWPLSFGNKRWHTMIWSQSYLKHKGKFLKMTSGWLLMLIADGHQSWTTSTALMPIRWVSVNVKTNDTEQIGKRSGSSALLKTIIWW